MGTAVPAYQKTDREALQPPGSPSEGRGSEAGRAAGTVPGPSRAWRHRGRPPGMGAATWMSRFSSFLVRRFRDTVAFSGQSAFRLRRGMWEVSRVRALGWQY